MQRHARLAARVGSGLHVQQLVCTRSSSTCTRISSPCSTRIHARMRQSSGCGTCSSTCTSSGCRTQQHAVACGGCPCRCVRQCGNDVGCGWLQPRADGCREREGHSGRPSRQQAGPGDDDTVGTACCGLVEACVCALHGTHPGWCTEHSAHTRAAFVSARAHMPYSKYCMHMPHPGLCIWRKASHGFTLGLVTCLLALRGEPSAWRGHLGGGPALGGEQHTSSAGLRASYPNRVDWIMTLTPPPECSDRRRPIFTRRAGK
eukprot:365676-Chlamydomonas_euryale.AAC.12